MKSSATARWTGPKLEGVVSAATGTFKDAPYSVKGRFEGDAPGTTPEELIAAAHAACFSMAFGLALGRNNLPPQLLETSAVVEVVRGEGGAQITESALSCTVVVPGGDAAKIREIAEGAKAGCPVSKALAGIKISLALDVKV
jgi:osmotically inducible protein OsmC